MTRSSRNSINSCTLSESRSAVGEQQSSEAHPEVHRRWAGKEGPRQFFVDIPTNDFWSLAAPDMKETLIGLDCPEYFQDDLNRVPTGTSTMDRDMQGPLARALKLTSIDGDLDLNFQNSSAVWHDAPTASPKLSPDVVVWKGDEWSEHWAMSRAFVEVNHGDEADPCPDGSGNLWASNLGIWNRIREYATVALNLQPRCFLLTASIFGSNARIFRWDRSMLMASSVFNYKKEPKPLYQFLYCVSQYADGGRDPSISYPLETLDEELLKDRYEQAKKAGLVPEFQPVIIWHYPDDESVLLQVPGQTPKDPTEVYLTMGPPLFGSGDLFGRGTRVWLATLADGSSPDFVVIKDTWRDANRVAEGEIYQSIEGIPGVARLGRAVDLDRGEHPDVHATIAKAINPKFSTPQYLERTHCRSIILSIGRPLYLFRSTLELTEAIRSALGGL
ncbi:hypothetical protein OE88DRAFT_1659734, partial [Heliocybe sulcata]